MVLALKVRPYMVLTLTMAEERTVDIYWLAHTVHKYSRRLLVSAYST